MYDHTLHRERKYFYCYCLQAFNIEEILKIHVEYCNGKQQVIMPKTGEFIKFKN